MNKKWRIGQNIRIYSKIDSVVHSYYLPEILGSIWDRLTASPAQTLDQLRPYTKQIVAREV